MVDLSEASVGETDMPDPATDLAMVAATTVVAAAATSAWQTVRERTVALFRGRGRSPEDIEAQLERSAARMEGAEEVAPVRARQIERWREDFEDLLREYPAAEEDVRVVIRDVRQQLPPVREQRIQHITASGGGPAFGAQGPGSSVHVHHDGEGVR